MTILRWAWRSGFLFFAAVVAGYFIVSCSSGNGTGDTGSPTTLATSTTTEGWLAPEVGSVPGEGWHALPTQRAVRVHAYLIQIPEPQPPPVRTPAAPEPAPAPRPRESVQAGGTPEFLACTRAHESDTAGGYGAVSPSGSFRGAYQFHQATWDTVAGWLGRSDLIGLPPDQASPADQDALAAELYRRQGNAPWGGRC